VPIKLQSEEKYAKFQKNIPFIILFTIHRETPPVDNYIFFFHSRFPGDFYSDEKRLFAKEKISVVGRGFFAAVI